MRITVTAIICALVAMLAAGPTAAQSGRIGLFADAQAMDCNIIDGPGVNNFSVYVILLDHTDAFSTDFSLVPGGGFAANWVSDTEVYPQTLGQSPTGVSVIMGGCIPAPTHVLTANYLGTGASATCSTITPMANGSVFPDGPAILPCATGIKVAVPADFIRINPDGFCDCTVPVEETTWGAIKNLYGER